ncbi:MAG: AbrB/MazE/SpoVT family DNA-binding domain-containing protein [Propionibacteriaceae bacterium]|nr:AbrB/MazE/SpoVT family DNA-binding domain-containing protein [Micropruina sp.]HBX81804.1 AbrB family transcriptional regulator [Propionibacteriaceae bacterium]
MAGPPPPPPGRLAGTAKVGEKGQIVIPKDMRDLFGINPGDTLLLLADVHRGIAIVRREEFASLAEAVLGDHPDA